MYRSLYKFQEVSSDDVLQSVAYCGLSLRNFENTKFSDDYHIVKPAVKNNGYSLIYASYRLRYDRELFEISLNNYYYCPCGKFVKKRYKELIIHYLSIDGMMLKNVSDHHKGDIEIVFSAVKNEPNALEYASSSWKKKSKLNKIRFIYETAVKKDGLSLKHTSKFAQDDINIVMIALSQNASCLQRFGIQTPNM